MFTDIILAALLGALPVALFTFMIMQWSIASGRMEKFDGEKNLRKQHKAYAKAQKEAKKSAKKEAKLKAQADPHIAEDAANKSTPSPADTPMFSRRKAGDLFHSKIMSFGGGFYGTMAILTYLLIETVEIWQFLGLVFTPDDWFQNFGFDMLVNFIINSITNLIAAFVWFGTLPDFLPVGNGWIWIAAAYTGYIAGLKLTTLHGDTLWQQLQTGWGKLKNQL
jgi:hypothetical protein